MDEFIDYNERLILVQQSDDGQYNGNTKFKIIGKLVPRVGRGWRKEWAKEHEKRIIYRNHHGLDFERNLIKHRVSKPQPVVQTQTPARPMPKPITPQPDRPFRGHAEDFEGACKGCGTPISHQTSGVRCPNCDRIYSFGEWFFLGKNSSRT